MAEILTFTLAAPLGTLGGVAVGERRTGADRPARSALLGLLAACLGVTRAEDEPHAELAAGLGLAVRREGPPGPLLTDYHTAQAPAARRGRDAFATRRGEVLSGDLETVLTRRDYRADLAFTAVAWRRDPPLRWTLADLAQALRTPRFVPYLGRKSCPLGLPMAPLLVDEPSVAAAFAARDRGANAEADARGVPERERRRLFGRRGRAVGVVWADRAGPGEPPLGLPEDRAERRRDAPLSRRRWQFGLRDEVAAAWPAAWPAAAP